MNKIAEKKCLQRIVSELIAQNHSVIVVNREDADPLERGYDILVR